MIEIKSSYVYLRNLKFYACHGVLKQECTVGNNYVVNVKIKFPIGKAAISDDVADALNYADVYNIIAREMAVPSKLLENLAYRICDNLCTTYTGIEEISLLVRKINPPMGADSDGAGVELNVINKK